MGPKELRSTNLREFPYLEERCSHLKSNLFIQTLNSTGAQENHLWFMTSALEEKEYLKLQITNKCRNELHIPREFLSLVTVSWVQSVGERRLIISREKSKETPKETKEKTQDLAEMTYKCGMMALLLLLSTEDILLQCTDS